MPKNPGISIAAAFEKVGKTALFDANTPTGAAFARFLKRLLARAYTEAQK